MLIKNNNKFNGRTKSVILVGYEGETIYRCYDPISKQICLSSSVKWNEISNLKLESDNIDITDNLANVSSVDLVDNKVSSDQPEMMIEDSVDPNQTENIDQNENHQRGRPFISD